MQPCMQHVFMERGAGVTILIRVQESVHFIAKLFSVF